MNASHLVSGIVGMLCPVPVIGEAALAYTFYPIISETPLTNENPAMTATISLATAALTRFTLYESMYFPMIHKITEYASRFG